MGTPLNIDCTSYRFTPNDRVLVTTPVPVSQEAQKRIREAVRRWVGHDIPVLVIDKSVKIEVISDS